MNQTATTLPAKHSYESGPRVASTSGGLCNLYRALLLAAVAISVTGCSGGSGDATGSGGGAASPSSGGAASPTTGTGALTVAVTDIEGRPLIDAQVSVFDRTQTRTIGARRTGSDGTATFGSVAPVVRVYVSHEFGVHARYDDFGVMQQGGTLLPVTLQASRPRPTVALLPVSIKPGSVSHDRSELTLEVTLVASRAAAFVPAGYGVSSPDSTPALGLALGQWNNSDQRHCFVWLDGKRTEPSCGPTWGPESPYTVSVERFTYDSVGMVPWLGMHGPARSAMLIMDQSRRVAELDPTARRSFALRRFIERAVEKSQPESLSVAGLAGTSSSSPSSMPSQPLWLPLGTENAFPADGAVLNAAPGMLEPYVGGTAPVLDSLRVAYDVAAAKAPPGNRAIVAMLGGGDDRDLSLEAHRSALAALRRQRDATGIQPVLIDGAPALSAQSLAIADLAATLEAPVISLGVSRTWASGSYAAFDLAADLISGASLPTLSAAFRVKATSPTTFAPGTTMHGVLYVESANCPMGCQEIPLEFAVDIP